MSSPNEYIELYSGNRNRLLYPNPSSYEVPFSSTKQIISGNKAEDPIINGAVYYTFSFQPCQIQNITVGIYKGLLTSYSTNTSFYIRTFNDTTFKLPYINDFFVGYIIQLTGSDDKRIIRNFDAQKSLLTLNEPWTDSTVNPANASFTIYFSFPTYDYIGIPAVDDNGNIGINTEGIYNGYYIIFETPYPAYSNQYNSNIFYRKITYYDNINRLAYFDTPLPFDYRDSNGNYPINIDIQTVTLRKSLPNERWRSGNIYYNKTISSNPIIGPLVGTVIVLPDGSSNIDNYYKGKYVYYYSRKTDLDINLTYDTENFLLQNLQNYTDKTLFSPIYGVYYIKAYNATTRELSIDQDVNNTSCGRDVHIDFPKAFNTETSLSNIFGGFNTVQYIPLEPSPGIYRINANNINPFFSQFSIRIFIQNFQPGKKYTINWTIRKSPTTNSLKLIQIRNGRFVYLTTNFNVQNDFTTFTAIIQDIGFGNSFDFYFQYEYPGPDIEVYVEWNYIQVGDDVSLNIVDFLKDNYSPYDYIGTMVSVEETTCYDISLTSLTLPNLNLKTGSRITFYPYVYVELVNISSPNKASNQLIYSNNPNSNRAVFIAPVGLRVNPNTGTFLTLYSKMVQTIKFKPNDSLRFSVYFSDGKLFETFISDIFPPYEPDPKLQIEAVFQVLRKTIATL